MAQARTGHLAAKDSPETPAKEQRISCDVSGPVKAICFPLPRVRGQITEYSHTHTYTQHRVPVHRLKLFHLCTLSFLCLSVYLF